MAFGVHAPLATVPRFLELAAGFRKGDPVVVTFYGGEEGSSLHFRWRAKEEGGGALPVVWDEALRQEAGMDLPGGMGTDRRWAG